MRSPNRPFASRHVSDAVRRGSLEQELEVCSLPPHVIQRLGELLRSYYVGLQMEPIPGRLIRVLDALDQRASHGH